MSAAQSRRMSALEAAVNVLVGYVVALAAQAVIFPLFGFHATLGQNAAIGVLFTLVSLVRSYCLRRFFEGLRARQGGGDHGRG